jgi:hypothetical protein
MLRFFCDRQVYARCAAKCVAHQSLVADPLHMPHPMRMRTAIPCQMQSDPMRKLLVLAMGLRMTLRVPAWQLRVAFRIGEWEMSDALRMGAYGIRTGVGGALH